MSIGLHCDGPECDTWTTDDTIIATQWFTLRTISRGVDTTWHFCCGWCMTKWGAERFEPTEVVE